MKDCPTCQQYQRELTRLTKENKHLAKQLQRAVKIIKNQKGQLDNVRIAAWYWICQARKAMSGHLPRGTWALWKGRLEVATEIYNLVWVDWATAFLNALGVK
jgi:hypothetical protein